MTTILTLQLDTSAQARFDTLRKLHYPQHLNRIAAHLTLFHSLPDTDDVRAVLVEAARAKQPFSLRVSGVMSLGRGVALAVQSPELDTLHAELAHALQDHLIPQDKQRFRAHVVVQNKVSVQQAVDLRASLEENFTPWSLTGEGLDWWDYLNGPWAMRERFQFSRGAREAAQNGER